MASQIDTIEGKLSEMEKYKTQSIMMLKALLDSQNELKQKLFLIRNAQSDIAKQFSRREKRDIAQDTNKVNENKVIDLYDDKKKVKVVGKRKPKNSL